MEFDKSRVYTAVNADELKIGSKCMFADTLGELRAYIWSDYTGNVLKGIENEHEEERFRDDQDSLWYLAYLIEPPAEPKYKPFESVEEAMKAIKAHGGWVKDSERNRTLLVHAYENNDKGRNLMVGFSWASLEDLYEIFVFADDGSPCGVLVEE